jgi:hypothetical protein
VFGRPQTGCSHLCQGKANIWPVLAVLRAPTYTLDSSNRRNLSSDTGTAASCAACARLCAVLISARDVVVDAPPSSVGLFSLVSGTDSKSSFSENDFQKSGSWKDEIWKLNLANIVHG